MPQQIQIRGTVIGLSLKGGGGSILERIILKMTIICWVLGEPQDIFCEIKAVLKYLR